MFCSSKTGADPGRGAAAGSRTQDTSGLSHQCVATEPWPRQPDNHQPSQSSIYTAQVVLFFLTFLYFRLITSLFPACGKMVLAFRGENHSAWVLSWRTEFSGQPLTEFWWHILSGCQVCDWGIQYHLCSTYRGLWGLVVVQLLWLSGRALAAQARGVLALTPGSCQPFFTFLYFCLITSKFIH